MENNSNFLYFAFISYAHEDLGVAKYIQEKIEHFPYPDKTPPENRPDHPEYIRPVFLDKTDLSARPIGFDKEIVEHLANSRYLIVVCSPNSAKPRAGAKRHYVDWEIQQFLKTHQNDTKSIFPVIYDGNLSKNDNMPSDLLSYFPPTILNYQEELTLRNLPDFRPDTEELNKDNPNVRQNWDNGVVKTISGLLNLNILDVYDRYTAEQNRSFFEQKKNYLQCIAIALIVLTVLIYLTGWAWVERSRAEKERFRAEQNESIAVEERDRAEGLLDFFRAVPKTVFFISIFFLTGPRLYNSRNFKKSISKMSLFY